MKLPKRLSIILKRKQDFIDSQRAKLESTVVRMQSKLFSDIIADLIPRLDIKDEIIQETVKNYRLLSVLDKTYKEFTFGSNLIVLDQIVKSTTQIASQSQSYFQVVLANNLPEQFENIISRADKLINLRLGLDGGKLVRGGFLESFFKSNTIGTELKQMTSKAVTSGVMLKDYVKQMKELITGTDIRAGGLERQYQRYAYDLYQQYSRAYDQQLGNEFGLTYFIYQGGLIKDSREFCVEHNGKVYSVEDTKDWCDWTSPTTGNKPTYMCYPGYDAMIDFGGYNCRHFPGWIPDELAFKMRPDLE
jgi:hypothetical protein